MNGRSRWELIWETRIVVLIVLVIVGATLANPRFLTPTSFGTIFRVISVEGIIVLGLAYLLIAGEIDLSVGATMALGAVLAVMAQSHGIGAGVAAGIGGGLLVGMANGFVVTRLRLDSIPATLGMMVLIQGIVFALTDRQTLKGTNPDFPVLDRAELLGIPLPILLFLLLCVALEFVLRKTVFGRHVYAVGGNAAAARLHGIPVDRVRFLTFVLVGALAGLAGVLQAARINIATGQIGFRTLLDVITALLLGGVSLAGGRGSALHAFQGILLVGVLNNALVLARVTPYFQPVIGGLVLIATVVVDSLEQRRRKYQAGSA